MNKVIIILLAAASFCLKSQAASSNPPTNPDLGAIYSQAKDTPFAPVGDAAVGLGVQSPNFSSDTQVEILELLNAASNNTTEVSSQLLAPKTPSHKDTYFEVQDVPLRSVVHLLARRCDLNYMEPPDNLQALDDNITLEMKTPTPATLLKWLLHLKNLELFDDKTGIYSIRTYTNQPAYYRFKLTDNFIDRFKGSAQGSSGGSSGGTGGGNAVSASQTFTVENGGKYGDIEGIVKKVADQNGDKDSKAWYFEEKQCILFYGTKEAAERVGRYLDIANERNPNIRIDCRIFATGNNPSSKLGVDWSSTMSPGLTFGLQPSGGSSGTNGGGNTLNSIYNSFKDPLNTVILQNNIQATLNFWIQDTHAEAVSEPSAITANDREVAFAATEQIPYVSGSSAVGSYGSSTVGYNNTAFVNVGATINILPRIQDGKKIKLGTAISISQLEQMVTVSSGGQNGSQQVPQTAGRAYNGEFTIMSGETVVIAGMKTHTISKSENKVPILGDLPILGRLFRNSSDSKNNAYLTIFITATIVDQDGNPRIPEGHVTTADKYPDNENDWLTASPNMNVLGRAGLVGDKAVMHARQENLAIRTAEANQIISRRLNLETKADILQQALSAQDDSIASLKNQKKQLTQNPDKFGANTLSQQITASLAQATATRAAIAKELQDCKTELDQLATKEAAANKAKETAEEEYSAALKSSITDTNSIP